MIFVHYVSFIISSYLKLAQLNEQICENLCSIFLVKHLEDVQAYVGYLQQ